MLELAPGTLIAGCRIEALAGTGGWAVVYRARHLVLEREVAVKVIAPEHAQDPRFRARFVRESRVAAAIDHPHVIRVYDAGEHEGQLYLTMQLVEGSDLRTELGRYGPLDPARAVAILRQVASALDAAHVHGLVHRDVKPANVLLSGQGDGDYAYLTDFGLTKHLDSRGGLTRTGMFVGMADYVAPEQVMGGPVDARADVYSLGCVLYHLLSGHVPYPRERAIATVTAHLTQSPPSVAALRADLADQFDRSSTPRCPRIPPRGTPARASSPTPPTRRNARPQATRPCTGRTPRAARPPQPPRPSGLRHRPSNPGGPATRHRTPGDPATAPPSPAAQAPSPVAARPGSRGATVSGCAGSRPLSGRRLLGLEPGRGEPRGGVARHSAWPARPRG
jgi:serine/threonine protein kinase